MGEAINKLLDSLEALLERFRLPKWSSLPAIMIIVLAFALIADFATGYTFFMQMERKLSVLDKLNQLAREGIMEHPELSPVYEEMVSDLYGYKVRLFFVPDNIHVPQGIDLARTGKFLSGTILGLLVALSEYRNKKRRETKERRSTILGGLLFAVLGGIISVAVPTVYNVWVNIVAFPFAFGAMILLLAKLAEKT